MRRKLRTAIGLGRRGRGLLARAWMRLLLVDLALQAWPLPKVQSLLRRLGSFGTPPRLPAISDPLPDPATTLTRLVGIAARHHLRPMRCLQQALVLQSLLAEAGIAAELRIGVRKEDRQLSAHAWLERDGRPLTEPAAALDRYQPLQLWADTAPPSLG